ncbi:MAG TPA: 3-dehydroquinate synthase [Bryobacteraceae bacterium]|nr:3-dehydroquinate synthase [Bryobacteraceae bacterium]
MPTYTVTTPRATYPIVAERGCLRTLKSHIPARIGTVFFVTTEDVWKLHGPALKNAMGGREFEVLLFPGSESHKRMADVEVLAEQMMQCGGDRASIVIAFGGGIVTDVGGFLAAVFMRGIPVIQIPTTLLAQVDAAIGGKTGVNLNAGKNLVGSFHQPLAVLIDPGLLDTLPEREYRAGLFEVIKHGIIADPDLFRMLHEEPESVLAQKQNVVDRMIWDSVRIKGQVVSGDEREEDRRRILNFGHTFGHALEAETAYSQFLHGEAVGWGMKTAAILGRMEGTCSDECTASIAECICLYGPFPGWRELNAERLFARLKSDKKTVKGLVHFVLPVEIGVVTITPEVAEHHVLAAIKESLE